MERKKSNFVLNSEQAFLEAPFFENPIISRASLRFPAVASAQGSDWGKRI